MLNIDMDNIMMLQYKRTELMESLKNINLNNQRYYDILNKVNDIDDDINLRLN